MSFMSFKKVYNLNHQYNVSLEYFFLQKQTLTSTIFQLMSKESCYINSINTPFGLKNKKKNKIKLMKFTKYLTKNQKIKFTNDSELYKIMVSFEQLITKGHSRLAYNRNRGTLDITNDKITLLHQDFVKEISYNEIESITRRKKGIIVIILKNGEFYELLDAMWAKSNNSLQDMRNAVRKTEIIYNLLLERGLEEKKQIPKKILKKQKLENELRKKGFDIESLKDYL